MKKASKIYLWAWAVFVVAAIVAVVAVMVIPSHHDLARDPYAIERIVKVDLPEIVEVECEVSKLAPPLGGKVGRVSVCLKG